MTPDGPAPSPAVPGLPATLVVHVTDRHPNDCYLTGPDVGFALRPILGSIVAGRPVLDPFAGAGTLLSWAAPDSQHHAWELDSRWRPHLYERVAPIRVRTGLDSIVTHWPAGWAIVTNPPFGPLPQAIERARQHHDETGQPIAYLTRTDWWQHAGRPALAGPDCSIGLLEWRPAFGWRWDDKAKRLVWSTDYAGYCWALWGVKAPTFIARPEVPAELVAEHKRLARIAYEMGHVPIAGAA